MQKEHKKESTFLGKTKDKKGNWLPISDNQEWDNIPFLNSTEIICEVKSSGKTFV